MNVKALLAAVLIAIAAPSLAQAADSCSGLKHAVWPHAAVASAEPVAAGAALVLVKGGPVFQAPLPFCRIVGVSRPAPRSRIGFEVWMPAGKRWNGKYLQVGNGGFAGDIPYSLLELGLARGYAVAGTDDGHTSPPGSIDASFALHGPEKVKDFGYRALKETTRAAHAAIAAFEGGPPQRAYFFGCSDGGREALMEAQRYAGDFDGIVAGAPAYAWTRLVGGGGLVEKALLQPGGFIPPAKLPVLERAALEACDGADGYIHAPDRCRFDPAALACKDGDGSDCLTAGELASATVIYGGATGPDSYVYPPSMPGAEAEPGSWQAWITGETPGKSAGYGFVEAYFGDLVTGKPPFDVSKLSFEDIEAGDRKLAGVLNSDNPDLSAFKARGGKLIQFHGWNDPAIPPGFSLAYAAAVKAKMGDPSGFYRLYMIPGMLHCGGGRGPSGVDWLTLLETWVEKGEAPGDVVARDEKGGAQTLKPWS